jgi:hypothetical protein
MRTWIGGAFLAVFTLAGVGFVLAGRSHPSHAGPCWSRSCSSPPPVSHPRRLPWVTFDEPPISDIIPVGWRVSAASGDR